MCVGTVVAKVAKRFLGLKGDEGPNEVVDNSCDQHDQQEDLGLNGTRTRYDWVTDCSILQQQILYQKKPKVNNK